jgi:hypothetical protein
MSVEALWLLREAVIVELSRKMDAERAKVEKVAPAWFGQFAQRLRSVA